VSLARASVVVIARWSKNKFIIFITFKILVLLQMIMVNFFEKIIWLYGLIDKFFLV
jgi:hypothetical protein